MDTKWVEAAAWPGLAQSLTADGWWFADLCGVDRLHLADSGLGGAAEPQEALEAAPRENDTEASRSDRARFEVVAQFLHRARRERAMVHVLAHGDPPAVPSITGLWPAADFMEREAFDLVGIVFSGHPNLVRIMLPEEWEGYPLRKDYGVGKVPIEFIPQPFLQFDSPHQQPNSLEGGVPVDRLGQPEVDPGTAAGSLSHFRDSKMRSQGPEEEGASP